MVTLLIYTALVTPFDVAFLSTAYNWLYFLNRFIDLLFFKDLVRPIHAHPRIRSMLNAVVQVMNFMTAFQTEDRILIKDRSTIVWNYCQGWFGIDLVSILPFDSIGKIVNDPNTSNLKILRMVRLLRLLKLLRILRSARIFKRWETSLTISFGAVTLSSTVHVLSVVLQVHCTF